MTAKRVPSKIVIAGNSKMSLNERFSSIPRPRPKAAVMKAQHNSYPSRNFHPRQYEEHVEYVPKPVIRRPRAAIQHRAVPFQSRVSFVNAVPAIQRFQPRHNFVQTSSKFQMNNTFRRPQFKPNFVQNQRNKFVYNNNNQNNRFQGNFHARKQPFPSMPKKKSLAELDRELDDYMRKPKHTPITV